MVDGLGLLVIERAGGTYQNRLRRYIVYVDGRRVGTLGPGTGQQLNVEVEPGQHVVYVRIDWLRSKPLEIGVVQGRELRLTIDMPRSGLGRFGMRPRITPEGA
ncbi:MAG TPA: hypothetical protein VGL75_15855 [Acidothermaceae bacterium]|jgi:hypothetical protein